MTKSFSEIFKQFTNLDNIYCGKILKGTILYINKNYAIIDTGLKSESKIPLNEFIDNNNNLEIKIGDKIDFILDSFEDKFGKVILSRKKAKIHKLWINLEKIYKNNYNIIGKVVEKVKGGFIILINNIRAFLPGSLIDFKSMNSDLLEKELEFKIIKLDKKNNNIVLSRKAVIYSESIFSKEEYINNIKINDIVSGVVKNITDYGAFIDLGLIDGLLHITDITWKRIKHPSEIVKLGEEIKVKVLNFDKSTSKISLGLKQLSKDPWFEIYNKYPKYTKVNGKVTNLTDYGFFVEIEDGIEGLVHISEMNWKYKNLHPSKIVKTNDLIEVMILEINIENRRISLGLKQCLENPWKKFQEKYQIGDKIEGIIKSITEFGIFVELNENLDGLIYISDLSWLINNINLINKYKKGDIIISKILNIDLNKLRVSLGLKQLTEDPFNEYINNNKIGDLINGKVININDNEFTVLINDYILGKFIPENKNLYKNILEENIYRFKIVDYNIKNRIINLILLENKYLDNKSNKLNNSNNLKINNVMTEAFKIAKNE